MKVNSYAAYESKTPLRSFTINRRDHKPNDVVIDIKYCGVCHSDLHQVKNEWGQSIFPMVPGHEIVGVVKAVGNKVTKFKVGDKVGVGCFVDSCRECKPCKAGMEQYCDQGMKQTYNSIDEDGRTPTYGGYSQSIVVDENYVLSIPNNLPLDAAAPLLCAGITTYSPLAHWKIKQGDKVGVIGLGGLGHMAVKIAHAMGALVTVFSTSDKKKEDAMKFGAKHFVNTKSQDALKGLDNQFDFIINTVSVNIHIEEYLNLLKLDGSLVQVGAPEKPSEINYFPLIFKRRHLAGSLIGGIKETQEMLDFCGKNDIASDIEIIPIQKINEAYERMLKGDVRYRFVIDIKSLEV